MLAELIQYGGLAAIVVACLAISWIDYNEHRIPNRIVGPLAGGTAVWLFLVGAASNDLSGALKAMLAGLAIVTVLFAVSILTNGIGMGDVKLVGPLASTLAWLGSTASLIAIVSIAAMSLAVSVFALASGKGLKHRVPLAPILTVGLIVGAIAHEIIQ